MSDPVGVVLESLKRKCKSCGADIIWAKTVKGKMMPVDYERSPSGNVRLQLVGSQVVALVQHGGSVADGTGRISHFASCPQATNWRKDKKSKGRPEERTPEGAGPS